MTPFMRGIMAFDDYNYDQYNEYILIQDPNEIANEKGGAGKDKNFKKRNYDDPLAELLAKKETKSNFSEKNLVKMQEKRYKHDAITIPPTTADLEAQ